MKVYAIDHIQLTMPADQEDKARSFYSRVLGIPEKPKPPHLAIRGGVWFEDEAVKVHLGVEKEFRLKELSRTERDGPFKVRCESCGQRHWYNYFSRTVTRADK